MLRADLQHAAVLPHGIDEDATLLNVERERFLRIHVLSRLAGVDAGQNPLEIADADDHGVDVRPVEHPAVVGAHVPRAAAGGLVLLRPRQIAVGKGDDPGGWGELVEQERRTVAHADRRHADRLVGGDAGLGTTAECRRTEKAQ